MQDQKYSFSTGFFIILLLFITGIFLGMVGTYLMAVFWAIILAVLFQNLQSWFVEKFPNRSNTTAALTLLTIILIVIIPVSLIGIAVVAEGSEFYNRLESGDIDIQKMLEGYKAHIPTVENTLERFNVNVEEFRTSFNEAITNATKTLAGKLVGFTQNTFTFVVQFSLMLYILFFFLRDGKSILDQLVWALPMGDTLEWRLIKRFESVTRATVKGNLVIASIQGTIGGLLFWAVGIPGAVLWGVLMTFFSLLPLGSGIIWVPAAIIFFTQGELGKALTIVLVGSLLIGLIDNLLRPKLVGSDTKMPDYLVLLSTLGGLTWFGVSGFILGPMVAAFFVTCWQILGEKQAESTPAESEPASEKE